jgi:hypothetical protein
LGWQTLSVSGPMARSAQDLALAMAAMSGPDDRSPISLEAPGEIFLNPLARSFKGCRVAFSANLGGLPVEPEVARVVESSRAVLQEMGCDVVNDEPDISEADEIFMLWRAWRTELRITPLLKEHRDQIKDTVIWNAEQGLPITGPQLARAEAKRTELYHRMREFFKKYDYEVEYVGNPLKDAIGAYSYDADFRKNNHLDDRPILAILPGSRKMELDKILPNMLLSAKDFKNYQVVIAGASNLPEEYYHKFDTAGFKMIFGKTYDILANAELAMVTSGTATLETALFSVPQVVCYRANALSVKIARMLVDIKFISLVNLIMDDKVVTELIQEDCSPEMISKELLKIEKGKSEREVMLAKYDVLLKKVGDAGASARAANSMFEFIK